MRPGYPKAAAALLAAFTLARCAPEASPAPSSPRSGTPPVSMHAFAPSAVGRAIELTGPLHPPPQSVAPSAAAFHAIFAQRLQDGPQVPAEGFIPRFDALEWSGAFWVLAQGAPRYYPRNASQAAPVLPHGETAAAPGQAFHPDLEPAAWEALNAGEEVVVWRADGRLHILGAVRAGPRCLGCHPWPAGQLEGAFHYDLAEVADD